MNGSAWSHDCQQKSFQWWLCLALSWISEDLSSTETKWLASHDKEQKRFPTRAHAPLLLADMRVIHQLNQTRLRSLLDIKWHLHVFPNFLIDFCTVNTLLSLYSSAVAHCGHCSSFISKSGKHSEWVHFKWTETPLSFFFRICSTGAQQMHTSLAS